MDHRPPVGSNVEIFHENDALRREIEILKSALLERCQVNHSEIGECASNKLHKANCFTQSLQIE